MPRILACGAELKNTICLTKGNVAFLSQHIGDLKYAAAYDFFTDTIEKMKTRFDIAPCGIAHDLHPDYLSTRYAVLQEETPLFPVQHHHAHLASCMAENGVEGDVIGIVCDGSGLGDDGHIWGGEILIANEREYHRAAHFSYTPMPGGDAAVREPWRMGLSLLHQVFGEECLGMESPFLNRLGRHQKTIITDMIRKKINTPMTSSLGRLFDGVAAIIGLRDHVTFEGQAALELEAKAPPNLEQIMEMTPYPISWEARSLCIIHAAPLIRGVVADLQNGLDLSIISGKFHYALILLFTKLAEKFSKESGLKRVALSGGVFQNALLLKGLIHHLEKQGLTVLTHRLAPTNDGGISLGQAWVASARYRSE